MLVILPDPTARRCPRHRDEYLTDSLPCPRCEGERLGHELVARLRRTLDEALAGAR